MKDEVYVYGSNLAARFVSGAQRTALRWYDADPATCRGMSGNAYAIALCDRELRPLPFATIAHSIEQLLSYAEANPHTDFYVPRFTLEYQGIAEREIAQCFARAPANCHLPGVWEQLQHPGLLKLLLVARWAGLSETDYELYYVWLHKYAKRLLTITGVGGVWCLADAGAQQHIGAWAAKEGVPFHALVPDAARYGKHAVTLLHERLLTACTEILAMESHSGYVRAVLTRARHLRIAARLIRRYPATSAEAAPPEPAALRATHMQPASPMHTSPAPAASPLRFPTAEDLQIHDPAGVHGTTDGTVAPRVPRKRSEAEDFPFGRIVEFAHG